MDRYNTFKIGEDKKSVSRTTCIVERNPRERLNVLTNVMNNSGIPLRDTLFINSERKWINQLGLQSIEKDNKSLFDWYSFAEADYLDDGMRIKMLSSIQPQLLSLMVGDGINQMTFKTYMRNVAKVVFMWKGSDLLDFINALLDANKVIEYIDRMPDILANKYREDIFYLRNVIKGIEKDQFVTSCIQSIQNRYSEIKDFNTGNRIDLSSFDSPLNIDLISTDNTLRLDYTYIFNKLYIYNTARIILKKRSPIMVVINNADRINLVDKEFIQLITSSMLYNMKLILLCDNMDNLSYFRYVLNNYYVEYIVNSYYIDDIETIKLFKDSIESG